MALGMEVKTAEDLIFRAISDIRQNSKRPDKESIVLHLTTSKGIGLVTQLILNTVDKLIENQSIFIKKHKGNDSFFVSKDTPDCGHDEDSGVIEELTSTKLKPKDHNVALIGHDASSTPVDKIDDSAIIGLAGSLGNMANAITNLNNILENERRKSNDLLLENFSLANQIRDLKENNEKVLLPEQTDSIRTIAVRTDLIKAAEHYNNRECEMAQSKEQLTSNNELNTEAKTDIAKGKDLKVNKILQNKIYRQRNKTKQQSSKPRDAVARGAKERLAERNERGTAQKLNVLVVGDSQLRHVKGEKLENDHRTVEVRFKPGMKIEEIKNKVGGSDNSDVIIVHAGTNNVKDKSPSDLAEVIVNSMELVQKKNPSARVAYSSIFKRKDDQTLNVKARKVNELLSEELSIRGIDFISNDNIIYSNLWKDGLHVNDGGVRKFSGNLSKFIKYC